MSAAVRACVRPCGCARLRALFPPACVHTCVRAYVRTCVRAWGRACVHACVRACVRAGVPTRYLGMMISREAGHITVTQRDYILTLVERYGMATARRPCVRPCMRACVRPCVRLCVRAAVRACVHASPPYTPPSALPSVSPSAPPSSPSVRACIPCGAGLLVVGRV